MRPAAISRIIAAWSPHDLYGLPLDRFVAERGALAKALRADRRRDEAKEVAALRKPSVAAWAVNQLVRTQDAGVGELLGAGDALRSAQEDLLAGRGDARALRAAGERERAAVEALVEAARGLLTSGGLELSEPVVERVADTLHAAALDEDAREQVREGRLERELRHVGLGLGLGRAQLFAPPPLPSSPSPSPPPRTARTRGRAERERDASARGASRPRHARRRARPRPPRGGAPSARPGRSAPPRSGASAPPARWPRPRTRWPAPARRPRRRSPSTRRRGRPSSGRGRFGPWAAACRPVTSTPRTGVRSCTCTVPEPPAPSSSATAPAAA